MINTHLHWGSTVDTGSEHSPGQSLSSFKQHIHTAIQPHLLSMKPSSKQTHRHTQRVATLRHIQAHSFQGSVYVVIDGIIYGQQKKMVMLRKQQSVCYNLTCNSSGGMSGEAWGIEQRLHVCVVVCSTVRMHASVCVSMCVCVSKCNGLGGGDCQPYIRSSDGTNQSPSRP